jgi:diguanylate cyclase (GGDEF)-like protein
MAIEVKSKAFLSRPPEIWSLVGIAVVAAVICLVGAFAPITMNRFVGSGLTFGFSLLGFALVVWFVGASTGRIGTFVATVALIGANSALIALAVTLEGRLLASFAFMWMSVYAASFFTRRQVLTVLVLAAAGQGAALAVSHVSRWPAIWVGLQATICGTSLILERAMSRIRRESETDSLTSLLNRRGFLKAAQLEVALFHRVNLPITVVVIDLDDFKSINDLQGHAAGDRHLIEATAAWNQELDSGDLLARFGGDEFVMMVVRNTPGAVEDLLERCRRAHPISWTAGVAQWLKDEPLETCLERADEHLYQRKLAKRASGRKERVAG